MNVHDRIINVQKIHIVKWLSIHIQVVSWTWICRVARLMEEREKRRSRAQDAFISLEDEQRRRTRAHAFIISVFSELSLVNTHFIMSPPPPFSGNSR